MTASGVTRPESNSVAVPLSCARNWLNLARVHRYDVENTITDQANLARANLHDDHNVQWRYFCQPLPEAAAEIHDRNSDSAQIEYPAHVFGSVGKRG
jgi:hypothetical protein